MHVVSSAFVCLFLLRIAGSGDRILYEPVYCFSFFDELAHGAFHVLGSAISWGRRVGSDVGIFQRQWGSCTIVVAIFKWR
jgi:hypothetical protein